MLSNQKKYTILLSVAGLATLFIFIGTVFAINNISDGWRIDNGATLDVTDASSACHRITNNSGSSLFVPTRTTSDWNAFASHLPGGVSSGSCCVSNIGQSCASAPNNCGSVNYGTILCSGACSATTPADQSLVRCRYCSTPISYLFCVMGCGRDSTCARACSTRYPDTCSYSYQCSC
ncbi:MAG: hypothetical protein WA064_03110 [Candidatus Moraniibacteriota bacterium]